MGTSASVQQTQGTQNQNKIFLDEGVGIEASQLSRRWTSKLSVLRNFETRQMSEYSQTIFRPQTHIMKSDSPIYSEEDEEISQSPSQRSLEDQPIKREINPINYKKITTFQSVSDDSDIEERQVQEQKKSRMKRYSPKASISCDSDNDSPTSCLKDRMQNLLNDMSDRDSLDSQQDLVFAEQLDVDDIMQQMGQVRQKLPPRFPLKRLYMRSRQGSDKVPPGQDKKVKFDAKQEEVFLMDDEVQQGQFQGGLEEERVYQPEDFLNQLGISVVCKKGNRKDGPHQSDYMIYSDLYSKVFILTDGHGEFGMQISYITYRLVFHNLIHSPLFFTKPDKCIQQVLSKVQEKLVKYIEKKKLDDTHNLLLSGCVITVAIQRDQKIYFGQIGDNKVFVLKEMKSKKQENILTELCPIHTPEEEEEKARVFNSGGEVRRINNEELIFVRGRLFPSLHVSRSIGDVIAHVIGVINEPFIKIYDVTVFDTFLIITNNSVFWHLTEDEIINLLVGFSLKQIKKACDSLYKQAKSSWIINEQIFDDMTIIMVWLGPNPEK